MIKYANRGKFLETVINNTNKIYKMKGVAVIDKIATPINYNKKGKSAFYEAKSTVDFVGCLNEGRMIAFDTKQTKQKSLRFANIGRHQEEYLRNISKLGGIAFFLIYFEAVNKYYRISINDYMYFKNNTGRKSIPIKFFEDNITEVRSKEGYPVHYLDGL
ncbi:MAG: Holliday junction resolvase RecU [Staphylococcus epidermidis]|jgi:recombination protein U|uniref:Holliday junction resolvase RecU n=1 Tax=uncultured Caudovirales phage TaxID=2100421 RepID=A0A2H4J2G2_9CAUD|nr:putative holliday junction-specific endonuclease RecU [uncultured Caudovirales phage]MDU6161096.1 Holliday junction resolvase RecU [Staphylococcus epidermidis]WGL30842.1 putative Holliday junction resolvase [Staphylococcus phage Southeast]